MSRTLKWENLGIVWMNVFSPILLYKLHCQFKDGSNSIFYLVIFFLVPSFMTSFLHCRVNKKYCNISSKQLKYGKYNLNWRLTLSPKQAIRLPHNTKKSKNCFFCDFTKETDRIWLFGWKFISQSVYWIWVFWARNPKTHVNFIESRWIIEDCGKSLHKLNLVLEWSFDWKVVIFASLRSILIKHETRRSEN